jgi:hypothetical protein
MFWQISLAVTAGLVLIRIIVYLVQQRRRAKIADPPSAPDSAGDPVLQEVEAPTTKSEGAP